MQSLKAKPSVSIRTQVPIPLKSCGQAGTFITFWGLEGTDEHFAIKLGPDTDTPLVRVHSECMTGDMFGSMLCDCGEQLSEALQHLSKEGGYLLYLRQEGRGIGLYAKLESYVLQAKGQDTFEANRSLGFADDLRSFLPAAQMLKALGEPRIKLLTNNPEKVAELEAHGVDVAETRKTGVYSNAHNMNYLSAKARAKHSIDLNQVQKTLEEVKV